MKKALGTVLVTLAVTLAAAQAPPPVAEGAVLRILQPAPEQKLPQSFVHASYEVLHPGAAVGNPTFVLRLDDREPVETTLSEHTFTGLAPGRHTLSVELVDANRTPIPNTRVQVEFTVTSLPRPNESEGPPAGKPDFWGKRKIVHAGFVASGDAGVFAQAENTLPAGGASPLIAFVGFVVLAAGILTRLRLSC